MHLLAQRGWWDNILANDLKGAEDHLGRGAAKQLWDEISVSILREQALLDVEEEHKAKRLPWGATKRIIKPFPKRGQLDTYIEGMDDEGDPEEIEKHALAWDDREALSESETETEKTAALAAAHPEVAIRRGLSEAQQRCAEEAWERVARLRRIQEEVKHLPNPRIRYMIEATIHHAQKQARGAGQTDKNIAAELRDRDMADLERRGRCKRPLARREARAALPPPPPPRL